MTEVIQANKTEAAFKDKVGINVVQSSRELLIVTGAEIDGLLI